MKKQQIKQLAITFAMLLGFAMVRAGYVPILSATPACHGNDGTITIAGTGVPGPFTMTIWGNGVYQSDTDVSYSATFTGLAPGVYSFDAFSDDYGADTGSFTISASDSGYLRNFQPVCPSGTTGTSIADVQGPAPLTYLWSNGTTSAAASNLPIGINSVSVTDGNGCLTVFYDTVTLTSPVHDVVTASGPVCAGILSVTASNGTAPYTYAWSNGATTSSISNLTNGVRYIVTITDASGCVSKDSGLVYNSNLNLDTTVIAEPGCNSGGAIAAHVLYGTAPFTYVWSTGQTTDSIINLAQGTYSVTVHDANGCSGTASYTLYNLNQPQAYINYQNPVCGYNNGYIWVHAYNGTGPYTYSWSNSSGHNMPVDSELAPGNYVVSIADSYGCTLADSIHLIPQGNFQAFINQTPAVCPATGSMRAYVNQAGNYTYLWSNGATTDSLTGLHGNDHFSVTVSDNSGCEAVATDTLREQTSFSIAIIPQACGNNITANITGNSFSPVSYVWNTGAIGQTITTSLYQTYYVTVTDAQGCSAVNYYNSGYQQPGIETDPNSYINANCSHAGSINPVVLNGQAPYAYYWSNGATTDSIGGIGLGYNQYTVTITDANGCSGASNYQLYGYALGDDYQVLNPSCSGVPGHIAVSTYDGTSPINFAWSNSNSNHTGYDSVQTAGTYYLTITDAGGCVITDTFNLINQGNFTVSISQTPGVCPAPGSMAATATGAGPYTWLWSNGATGQTISTPPTVQYYSVTATDGNGCQAESTDSVIFFSPVNLTFISGACSDSLTVLATDGTAPYTYAWTNGGGTSNTFNAQPNQVYWVSVTDHNGCTATGYGYSGPVGLQIDSSNSLVLPTCNHPSSGQITVHVSNDAGPYTYNWANGATTQTISGLTSGAYYVTITDANGCSGVGYYYLQGTLLTSNAYYNNPLCQTSSGSITLNIYGGTPPYNYAWSNIAANTATQYSIPAGTYYCTITDNGGCLIKDTTVLTGQGSFTIQVTTTPSACTQPTGTATCTVSSGGTAPYTFDWQIDTNGVNYSETTTGTLTGLPGGATLSVLITDAHGCVDSIAWYNNSDSGYVAFAPNCYDSITGYVYADANGNCMHDAGEQGLGNIIVTAIDANGNYHYAITDSTGYYSFNVLPGTYSVSVYISAFCSGTTCTSMLTVSTSGAGNIFANNNFGFSVSQNFDLVVHTGYSPSTPGNTKQYWVYYYNNGNVTSPNAVLTFVHDPNLSLVSTNPPYTSYNAATQTLVWNLGAVSPSASINFGQQVTMLFDVPATLSLGTYLTVYDSIAPLTGDCNPTNNVELLTDLVTGSHDPNHKEVSPAGPLPPGDTVLNYTIRFQNTGNAPATKIVIVDTLSPLVNPATLVMGASSDKYSYTLTGNGVLTITFYPINLPDSTQNPASSEGFVIYSISTRSADATGSQIKNTAYIYFDQNPAVVTNTTETTLSPFGVGFNNLTAGAMTVRVSPNPMHDFSEFKVNGYTGNLQFEVDDIAGQKIFEKTTADPTIMFDCSSYEAGVYIYIARDAAGNTCTGKVVIVR